MKQKVLQKEYTNIVGMVHTRKKKLMGLWRKVIA